MSKEFLLVVLGLISMLLQQWGSSVLPVFSVTVKSIDTYIRLIGVSVCVEQCRSLLRTVVQKWY